jgi:hypothetical protein
MEDTRQIGSNRARNKKGRARSPAFSTVLLLALLLLRSRALHFLAVDRDFVASFFVFAGVGQHVALLLSSESDRGERCNGERAGDQSGQKLRHDVSSFKWMGAAFDRQAGQGRLTGHRQLR